MGRKRKIPGGEPEAAKNPVAEDDGKDPIPEPGAEASLDDDGPLPEDVDPEGAETNAGADDAVDEADARGEDAEAVAAAPKATKGKAPKPAVAKVVDPRAELRTKLGEPAPFPGAVIGSDGRVETPPPGWDPTKRKPQRP